MRGDRIGGPIRWRMHIPAAVEKVFEAWEYWRAEIERIDSECDRVAVAVRYTARGRGSGMEIEGSESALWTLRDGRVVRYEWFHGRNDAFDRSD